MPVIQVADNEKAKLAADSVYVIAPDRKLENNRQLGRRVLV